MASIACFVSPHGFGHAARACAVIEALGEAAPGLRFHIFTTVPRWFFAESLSVRFEYHRCACDVGLVQTSPLEEDIGATIRALDRAPWRDPEIIGGLADRLGTLGCALVIADISPLGLRLARHAGLPSVLVENFTWDWIYNRLEAPAGLERHADELAKVFGDVDLHLQTRPVCQPLTNAAGTGMVARKPRMPRAEVRRHLGIPDDEAMVLASMGGVSWDFGDLDHLARGEVAWVVVPGGGSLAKQRGRLVLLPFHSAHYHPDLVRAADVVVGKLGYSTVAESSQSGVALAYVERPGFPESPVLAEYVDRHFTSRRLGRRDFAAGEWMPVVNQLLSVPRKAPPAAEGAAEAAALIVNRFPELFDE